MDDPVARARVLIDKWDAQLRRALPPDAQIFDAHLHLGHDIDGMFGEYDELERVLTRYGISRAFMFCMDEPDRHPAFRAPNDRTLEREDCLGIPIAGAFGRRGCIGERSRCSRSGRSRSVCGSCRHLVVIAVAKRDGERSSAVGRRGK